MVHAIRLKEYGEPEVLSWQQVEVGKPAAGLPTMDLWSYPGQGGWYAPLARTEVTVVSFDPLVEQFRHFLAVIAGDEMPLISVGDAMRTLAVVEAVREAARTGGRISPSRTVEQAG
jgi:predicted dehydrogenase